MTMTDTAATGFVRREGPQLVDGEGRQRHFRGVGIGNWLLVEGYMWRFFAGATRPRTIEALFHHLTGSDEGWSSDFWRRFRDEFFTAADVARIAEAGFDHVRVPFNWRLFIDLDGQFIDEGFDRLADVVEWCRQAGLLVLFDLHGAPGGQTGSNIDDCEHDRPELFSDERYRQLCVRLWTEIARRWADEPVVMGYDLLNEPLRDEFQHQYGDDLAALYRELTAAIRSVDGNHLLMYEGSHWATNFSIFDAVWDENSCLQFHRYWDRPDRAGLAKFLEPATRLGLPLYMGEGGENSYGWMRAAFGGYDQLGISWNFWPWKKLANPSSPADAVAPDGWQQIIDAAQAWPDEVADGLSVEQARAVLDDVVSAFRIENCDWHGDLVDALLQAPHGFVPAIAVVGGPDGRRWEPQGGDAAISPYDADPARRTSAPVEVLLLAAGESAEFAVSAAPAQVGVVEADSSPSPVAVVSGEQVITVTGGPDGSHLIGLQLS